MYDWACYCLWFLFDNWPYSDVIITDTVFDILGTARTIAARMLVAFVVFAFAGDPCGLETTLKALGFSYVHRQTKSTIANEIISKMAVNWLFHLK
ncbi:hypothetical protein O9992_15465 [Vibrio lentus]|nr:hypothetical protein [Vibrio lentus]